MTQRRVVCSCLCAWFLLGGRSWAVPVDFLQPPAANQERIASNLDLVDGSPSVALSDDFIGDGRAVTGVRFWGGSLAGEAVEGWLVGFFSPVSDGAGAVEPLGLYFCDAGVVQQVAAPFSSCDVGAVMEYTVTLSDCCLLHQNVDPRTELMPASGAAFQTEVCLAYDLSVTAVVGSTYANGQVPDQPAFLGSADGSSTHSMWPTSDGRFVVTGEERFGGGITVFEITENGGSVTLTQRDSLAFPTNQAFSVHNQVIVGNRLYNSWYELGFKVLDIDPVTGLLTDVLTFNTSNGGLGNWGVYPFLGEDRILLSDEETGLWVFDMVSQTAVGQWDGYFGSYSDVWGDGDFAYLANWPLGDGQAPRVFVIDVSDPNNPTLANTIFFDPPNQFTSPQDVKVGDGMLFVALEADTNDSVAIFDVRSPPAAPLLATIRIPTFQDPHNLFYDNGFLYMADSSTPRVAIVDLTNFDPDNPPPSPMTDVRWILTNVGSSFVHDITVVGGRLYAAGWNSGVWIYDVTRTVPGCVRTPTGNSAAGSFWGWYSTTAEVGVRGPLSAPVTGGSGDAWVFGPWGPAAATCGAGGLSFELISTDADPMVDCACLTSEDCDDSVFCTFDRCSSGVCSSEPLVYGDVDGNTIVNIFDLFCVIDGLSGSFADCSLGNVDISPCGGDGLVTVFDLFALLDAMNGLGGCCPG